MSRLEYGDYQTPVDFSRLVCKKLKDRYGISPANLFEPTFGIGNFIESAIDEFPEIRSVYGVEINRDYFEITKQKNQSKSVLFNEDIFSFDFSNLHERIDKDEEFLILGNPPWVTNSQLSSVSSYNIPMKENFKGLTGLDAITGKGNFDVAEYITLQLLSEFQDYNCTVALLCKNIVAKNIIRDMHKYSFNISQADMYIFDALSVFNVNCDAGLLVLKLGTTRTDICSVYDFNSDKIIKQFGWVDGRFLSDISGASITSKIDGACQFEWRQGVKHDCSKVMELKTDKDGIFINGLGEQLQLPVGRYLFPLIKSSDIKSDVIKTTRKHVIVTQRKVKADTSVIGKEEPAIWEYLIKHQDKLNARKSSIYKNSPIFSMFGVGDYSFSQYKIGISGFYKEPKFALIYGENPIMLDDTCYFLSFDSRSDALITLALLNSEDCIKFLKSVAFLDAKRPYTKEILKRIDILGLYQSISFSDITDYIAKLDKDYLISQQDYEYYLSSLELKIAS